VKAKDKDGWTPLHVAAVAGSEAVCGQLVESGADPGARDARGGTPVDWARRMGNDAAAAALQKR
jgi:ankyrin repeat protein